MFTGIIETQGKLMEAATERTNLTLTVLSPISSELKPDQSVSHNGVCLTVTHADQYSHRVVAVQETLSKSTLGALVIGESVNLERCLSVGSRIDGHLVQGHVDGKATCTEIREVGGSWTFRFAYDPTNGFFTVEKGSICINGVSLTAFNSKPGEFEVAIIPYTHEHTNFSSLKVGSAVNLEFDVIGKYVTTYLSQIGIQH